MTRPYAVDTTGLPILFSGHFHTWRVEANSAAPVQHKTTASATLDWALGAS